MSTTTIHRILPTLLVLAITAGLIAGCGGGNEDQPARGGNVTDRAFINDMIPHHRSAIAMATIAQTHAAHAQVTRLATSIIDDQQREIVLMGRLKKQLTAGTAKSTLGESMRAMGMDMDISSLQHAKPFDDAFIQMMSPHHAGAITMAKMELADGEDPEVRALAQRIITAQTKEIAQMKRWRATWYPHTGVSMSGGMHMG